jgi:hypothetical protein
MSDELFYRKIAFLKRLAWLALVGSLIGLVGIARSEPPEAPSWLFFGFILVIPAALYLLLLTMWHWKGRYVGVHSDLWGGILVLETSGWFKLVYLFRHIIPDARGTGRYERSGPIDSAQKNSRVPAG